MNEEIRRMIAEARERAAKVEAARTEAEQQQKHQEELAAQTLFEDSVREALGPKIMLTLGRHYVMGNKGAGYYLEFFNGPGPGRRLRINQTSGTSVELSIEPGSRGSAFNLKATDAQETFLLRLGDLLDQRY